MASSRPLGKNDESRDDWVVTAFLQHQSLGRSTMPTGVYERKRKMTAEQKRERQADYYAANRGQIAKQQKQYRAANSKQLAQQRKQYRVENRDDLTAYKKRYAKDHPEVRRGDNSKRRARKRNAIIGDTKLITAWESKWRLQKTVVCHWCGSRIKTVLAHVDHVVPLAKGGAHAVENLCVACSVCNLSKSSKSPEVWNTTLKQPLLFV